MPTIVQAALLGVVQGLTEFLPVSSSAHLILARAFFGWDADRFGLAFDVACHVGTLISLLVYFRREMEQMLASLPRMSWPGGREPLSGVDSGPQDPGSRLIWLLVIGTIPAVIVGALFSEQIEEHLRRPPIAVTALALGAVGLLIAERAGEKTRGDESLTMSEAFWVGCAQAMALIPGVSRSGATLTVALLLGLRRAEAARFIFLLGTPAILAAALNEAPKVLTAGSDGDTATLFLVGAVTSAIVGYLAVRFFIHYLAKHSVDLFAWYRIVLAAASVVWLFG